MSLLLTTYLLEHLDNDFVFDSLSINDILALEHEVCTYMVFVVVQVLFIKVRGLYKFYSSKLGAVHV